MQITKNNYAKYLGSTYLDDTYTKYTAPIAIFYMISIAGMVVAFEELQKRNSNIMFGYNFENLNSYNKMQKV